MHLDRLIAVRKCQQGVCVTVDDTLYSVTPETASEFFETQIRAMLAK